jgi:hypothetical protein
MSGKLTPEDFSVTWKLTPEMREALLGLLANHHSEQFRDTAIGEALDKSYKQAESVTKEGLYDFLQQNDYHMSKNITKLTLMSYEISFQFTQGELDWTDNLLFDAYSIPELIQQVKTYIAQFDDERDEDDSMTVLFAQVLDDDLDVDVRDITDLFPEEMLTE